MGAENFSRYPSTLFTRLSWHLNLLLLAVIFALISFSLWVVVFADHRLEVLILLAKVFHLGDFKVYDLIIICIENIMRSHALGAARLRTINFRTYFNKKIVKMKPSRH